MTQNHCWVAGAPALPPRLLQRPHAHGVWVANATAPAASGAPDPAAIGGGEGVEAASAERVAAEDPLCGLLQMQARCTPPTILDRQRDMWTAWCRSAHLRRLSRPL